MFEESLKSKLIKLFLELPDTKVFFTNCTYKIEKKVKISNVFPIYIDNLTKLELNEIKKECFEKIYSFLNLFDSLSEFIQLDVFNVDKKYISITEQIRELKDAYESYIKNNDELLIEKMVLCNDKKSFAMRLSDYINKYIVIIRVKRWEKIDENIMKYFSCDVQTIINAEYRNYFLKQFINLFNLNNFDLTTFSGIKLRDYFNNTFFNFNIRNSEFTKQFENIINNVFLIDSFVKNENDIMNLFSFLIILEDNRFIKCKKYIVDFVIFIESILVEKTDKISIENQFRLKVRKCCKLSKYNISGDELYDLYNYRSILVHGNYYEMEKALNEITNKKWYRDLLDQLNDTCKSEYADIGEREELIYRRLFQIFNIIYKMYCKNKKSIVKLKKVVDKNEINNFTID